MTKIEELTEKLIENGQEQLRTEISYLIEWNIDRTRIGVDEYLKLSDVLEAINDALK